MEDETPRARGEIILPRADRVTRGDRGMLLLRRVRGRLFCLAGRHLWVRRTEPGVAGPRATYEICRRCAHERTGYLPGWRYFER